METITRIFDGHLQRISVEEADQDLREFAANYSCEIRWYFTRKMVTVDVKWCGKPTAVYLTRF